jgi:hypothetical protein
MGFESTPFPWWDYVYYRNYRLWSGALETVDVVSVSTTYLGELMARNVLVWKGLKALSFYRFADSSSVQQDLVANGSYWLIDQTRPNLRSTDFMVRSREFDETITGATFQPYPTAIEDILHVTEGTGKTGPQLTIPSATLSEATGVTVELWLAFESFTAQNFTVVGIAGRPWYHGFGIGGTMTSNFVSLTCELDVAPFTITGSNCAACPNPLLCKTFQAAAKVWMHYACSRQGASRAQTILNSDATEINATTPYNASIGSLFTPGNLVLGVRNPILKDAGFIGYVRELRIWNVWLEKHQVLALLNTYAC